MEHSAGMRRGFGLIEILIAVAVIAVLVGGSFYLSGLHKVNGNNSVLPPGASTPQQIVNYASATLQQANASTAQEQDILNQLGGNAGASATGTLPLPPQAAPNGHGKGS